MFSFYKILKSNIFMYFLMLQILNVKKLHLSWQQLEKKIKKGRMIEVEQLANSVCVEEPLAGKEEEIKLKNPSFDCHDTEI